MKTLSEFWAVVASKTSHPAYRNHRYGQIVFNTLYAFKPALANNIAGSFLDPFHKDIEVIADDPAFVAFCNLLEREWDK